MSCNHIPLSYESLKCVIQYFEANFRIHLSQCIPSIRAAEKSTSFKIDDLFLDPLSVKINETIYQLGIIRTCKNGELLKTFERANKRGGVEYDLDKFEARDMSFEKVVLPGDVLIENDETGVPEQRQGPTLEQLEAQLKSRLKEKSSNARSKTFDQSDIDSTIDYLQAQILPLRLKRDNHESPNVNYIQLTIFKELSVNRQKIERVEYNKKIYEAAKYLNSIIFGERRNNIHVKCIHFNFDGGIFRYPEGLKMRIEKIATGRSVGRILNGLKSIIHESSLPLKTIEINSGYYPDDFDGLGHPLFQGIDQVIISDAPVEFEWRNVFSKLPNRKIHWKYSRFSHEQFMTFVQNWLDTGRRIGTCFYFGEMKNNKFKNGIESLLQKLPNVKVTMYTSFFPLYTFPLGNFTELNIFGEYERYARSEFDWVLKMKVMPAGSMNLFDQ